jgi:hypothetical protein
MPRAAGYGTMLLMSATLDLTRRVLIEVDVSRSAVSKVPVVRRYRLAQDSLCTRPEPTLDRFAHLRRSYD